MGEMPVRQMFATFEYWVLIFLGRSVRYPIECTVLDQSQTQIVHSVQRDGNVDSIYTL
jgi:hypothetical protein